MSLRSSVVVAGKTMSACLAVAVHQISLTTMVSGLVHASRSRGPTVKEEWTPRHGPEQSQETRKPCIGEDAASSFVLFRPSLKPPARGVLAAPRACAGVDERRAGSHASRRTPRATFANRPRVGLCRVRTSVVFVSAWPSAEKFYRPPVKSPKIADQWH